MNFTFLVVVLLTALAFVGVVIALSRAISPRSYNVQKFEAYECGIPTRGKSWMQFRVGYYLFAILFLMFDVETAFLFPWAVVMREMGPQGLIRSGNSMPEGQTSLSEFSMTLSTGDAAIRCGRLLSLPVVVVSNLWHWVPRVMIWPVLGLK